MELSITLAAVMVLREGEILLSVILHLKNVVLQIGFAV